MMANRIRMDLLALVLRQDPGTFAHCVRVGMLAKAMAKVVKMSDQEIEMFSAACSFHDIGKLFLPKELLLRREPLDETEKALMREHPKLGVQLLRHRLGWKNKEMLDTVRSHHERWDGQGYPDGLRGADIPPWARMCAIIDAYDAMVQPRPYNRVKTPEQAREELCKQSGRHFDRTYVDAFLEIPQLSIEQATVCP